MKIIEGTTTFQIEDECAVAIGKFDGFHIGHQTLLNAVAKHKDEGLKVAIFTFYPSPASFFSKTKVKELMTREEKRRIFEKAGVDILVEYPFFEQVAAISPEEFIEAVLVEQMHAKWIVAGTDLSFGYKGAGNIALIEKMAEQYDYQVEIIKKVSLHGKEISSTYVREAVRDGNMKLAEELLGVPFRVTGKVAYGNQLGRTMGMPTANMYPSDEKLLPPYGVYYARVYVDGQCYKGICNIGEKPTVSEEKRISVETYLYQYQGDLYGKEMTVELLEFRRPEQKFEGLEQLKEQMQKDIRAGAIYQ